MNDGSSGTSGPRQCSPADPHDARATQREPECLTWPHGQRAAPPLHAVGRAPRLRAHARALRAGRRGQRARLSRLALHPPLAPRPPGSGPRGPRVPRVAASHSGCPRVRRVRHRERAGDGAGGRPDGCPRGHRVRSDVRRAKATARTAPALRASLPLNARARRRPLPHHSRAARAAVRVECASAQLPNHLRRLLRYCYVIRSFMLSIAFITDYNYY